MKVSIQNVEQYESRLEKEKKYWFASIDGISSKRKRILYEETQGIENLYEIASYKQSHLCTVTEEELSLIEESKLNWNLEERYTQFRRLEGDFHIYGEEGYPNKLMDYEDAPFALFYRGVLPDDEVLTVAIVGARRCSEYGAYYAREYGGALAQSGIQVISGMATGIDGISQRAVLEKKGISFGVLGCGVDICYPRENKGLYQDLLAFGGVISEQPMGKPPMAHHFPLRNRIISGLADVVLIIEAKERSGSLITADLAMDQGKDVYAMPGDATSALSMGCHKLIKQGAGILINPQELMKDLEVYGNFHKKKLKENKIILESAEKLVYSCLCLRPLHIEEILSRTNLPIQELMNHLISLELQGYVREVTKNYYVRNKLI